MKPFDVAAAIAVAFLWGSNFVVLKDAFAQFPPLLFMALRFALVALVTVPFLGRPSRAELKAMGPLTLVLGFGHFGLVAWSLDGLEAATAIILTNSHTALSALIAWLAFGERPGLRRAAGMALAFGGVVLIAGGPSAEQALVPALAALAASLAWTVGNFQIKRLPPLDGAMLNSWMAMCAAPQLFLASVLVEREQWSRLAAVDANGVAALLYTALLVYIVGYGLWFGLLRRHAVNRVVPFTLLVPVFGIALSVLFLDERPGWGFALGAAATIGGVALIVLGPDTKLAGRCERA